MRPPVPDHEDNGPDSGIFGINSQVLLGFVVVSAILIAALVML